MKVLRTINTFYPQVTGPANQAYEISTGLVERGHRSIIVTIKHSPSVPETETIDGVHVRRFGSFDRLPYGLSVGAGKTLLGTDADVIHAHSYRNFLTDAACLTSRLKSIPFVLHGHGTFYGYRKILHESGHRRYELYDRLTGRRAAHWADAVVVSTEQEKEEAIEFGIDESAIYVVPVGKRIGEYEAIPKQSPDDEFRLLFVGRLDPSRNVEQVIEALAILPSDVTLRVVGDEVKRSEASVHGYLNRLESLSERRGVADRVTFTGAKYDNDLIREYRSADVFVYPSRYENFGQTVLEAAAAGTPVVATPEGVARDLVTESETGFLVEPDDVDTTASRIQAVREIGPDILGSAIQQRVREQYTWETIHDQYLSIYREIQ